VALSTGNQAFPLSLVVYDRVTSTDPGFKKTWLLHSVQEPAVTGNGARISNSTEASWAGGNYSGALWVNNLLPADATIEKVGGPGREFWIAGVSTNYATFKDREGAEPGAWRIEISPPVPAAFDAFLNVLSVTGMEISALPTVQAVTGDQVTGAVVFDRVVLFNKTDGLLGGPVTFSLTDAKTYKILVTDLQPGTWVVEKDGQPHSVLPAAQEKKSLYFQGTAGNYTLRLDNTGIDDNPPSPRESFSVRCDNHGQLLIRFISTGKLPVLISIHDLQGRCIKLLSNRIFPAGCHTLSTAFQNSPPFFSGMYLVYAEIGSYSVIQKIYIP